MPIETIQIIRTAQMPFDKVPYMIHPLARHWRALGLEVDVVDPLREPARDDVLLIPHFDLTVRPEPVAGPIERSANVVNRAVVNVAKRAISSQLVTAPEQYDGPVLVKSNRNFGGIPEAKLQRGHVAAGRAADGPVPPVIHWTNYPIYDHPRLVPPTVWNYRPVVVEKFLPEKEDGLFCLRQYIFLGDAGIHTRAFSPEPIVKSVNVVRREVFDEPPPAGVMAVRKRLGFDYGKFDFVIHDGQAIVFDVNPTPTYNRRSKAGSQEGMIAHLAGGIRSLLEPA